MSSICGAVYLNHENVCKDRIVSMMNLLSVHPYDKSSVWNEGSAFLGCNLQYITKESRIEVLPRKDVISGLSITADALIDNRAELFSKLNIPQEERKLMTDSELILRAYKRFGKNCPKHIEGDYAFAIWDYYNQELFCARDHVGKRTLYYYKDKDFLIFSTTMKPIHGFLNKKLSLNERWIADYLGLLGVIHELECNDTIYEGIYQLKPAAMLTFNHKGIVTDSYWNALSVKKIRFKNDYEYNEAFMDVFSKAVKARLRTDGKVGIFMSGGLDSTAVGALAAKELAQDNKQLLAYHALPIKAYNNTLSPHWITDESEYINELIKMYPNISIKNLRSENKNSYNDLHYFTRVLEHPFKPVVNFYWVNDIFAQASSDGCKVILDGQYGNFSISYGSYLTNIFELLKRAKFYSIYKEINGYSKLYNVNRNYIAKKTIDSFIPHNLYERIFKTNTKLSIINPDLDKKWRVSERISASFNNRNIFGIESIKEMRRFYTNPSFFSHLGSIETKMGLANGLINRDPTRDKNVIEFCSSVPWHQFVKDGKERYLVRKGMAGIVPDKIRNNYTFRGKQGADWIQRIVPYWKDIRNEFQNMLNDSTLGYYVDTETYKGLLSELTDINQIELQNKYSVELKDLFICLVFYNYLKEYST